MVDTSGTADFVRIQDAVNAAQAGDTILVRRQHEALWLEGFEIDGKGLSVVAFDEERLPITAIRIRNLGPGQTCVLSGFEILTESSEAIHPLSMGPADPLAPGLHLENNSGSVRIQDCGIAGSIGWNFPAFQGPGTHAIDSSGSLDVTFSLCEVLGGAGYEDPNSAGFALSSTLSRVNAYDCLLVGGEGGFDIGFMNDSTGGPGGDGVRVLGGNLFLANCAVSGGYGGCGGGFSASFGGPGGHGVVVLNGASAQALSTEIAPGVGGFGMTANGPDGVDVRGPLAVLTNGLPTLSTPRGYAWESSTIDLEVLGTPGADAYLLVSSGTTSVALAPEQGFLHTTNAERVHLGVIPTGGTLVAPFSLPSVASGAAVLHLQVALKEGTSPPKLSGPRVVTVLDEALQPVCGGRVYVDQSVPAGGDGASWTTAYNDLRSALNAQPSCAENPTEVWVAQGIYAPAPSGGDTSLSFRLHSGVHLYGGFAGHETQLGERDPRLHPVVLSGDLRSNDTAGFGNRADNSEHVVRTGSLLFRSSNVRLDSVTVRGGESLGISAEEGGAGIQARCDGLVIARCLVEGNRTAGTGTGVGGSGAGLLQWRSGDTWVLESVFRGNAAGGNGGGFRIRSDDTFARTTIANCLVAGNTATIYAGGIEVSTIVGKLIGTTVYANSAGTWGGVKVHTENGLTVANCVIWSNTDSQAFTDLFEENFEQPFQAWSFMRHSCVEGWNGLGGATNTGQDPLFIDGFGADGQPRTGDDDLRLAPFSPCVDSGKNSAVPPDFADLDDDGNTSEQIPTDLDHRRRFLDDPLTPDTGAGTAPFVDMGAYERTGP